MSQMEFEGLDPPDQLTDEDWQAKDYELSDLFSPSAPVQEAELFAGRVDQLGRLIDAVFERGQSAVVYGHRGVGKTSLINIFQKRIFPTSSTILFFSTRCFAKDDFHDAWLRAVGDYAFESGDELAEYIDDSISPQTILDLTNRFKTIYRPVFIFDEFDRVEDQDTKLRMAETIKLISDEAPNTTIVIVGIAHTIRDLLLEHESVKRAARQIEMPRMSRNETRDLVSLRLAKVGMTMEENGLSAVATLSRGMPGYAHLLGKYSSRQAIMRRSLTVETEDVLASLEQVLEEAGESTKQEYAKAVNSTKPNNQFKEALLACALAKQNEFGSFTAAAVREPISKILGSQRDIPAYARHLNAFGTKDRGPILERSGTPKSYTYRFIEPHMQSYVIIKGIKDSLIRADDPTVMVNLT